MRILKCIFILFLNKYRIERRTKLVTLDVEKLILKKEEYYKGKIETINHILILKPFYKKFCVIRSNESEIAITTENDISLTSQNPKNFLIQKNRKILSISEIESLFKFDYIISLIDNPYEEIKYVKETTYINDELISIFMSYLIQMNSCNDERNFVGLYLTNFNNNNSQLNNNITSIVQSLVNKISHFNDYTFTIKGISKSNIFNITKETIFSENLSSSSSINSKMSLVFKEANELIIKAVGSEDEVIGYVFCIRNVKNESKMKIFNLSFKDQNLVSSVISKFNDINVSKKKREKSSKKKRGNKEFQYIFDEMNISFGFYFATIVDVNCRDFSEFSKKDSNFKDILINI
jgi:hypothetical protein